jgi:hypothetical protein
VHPEVALGGWNPDVRAARVEDDGEGRVDADLPKVLHIHIVLERDMSPSSSEQLSPSSSEQYKQNFAEHISILQEKKNKFSKPEINKNLSRESNITIGLLMVLL